MPDRRLWGGLYARHPARRAARRSRWGWLYACHLALRHPLRFLEKPQQRHPRRVWALPRAFRQILLHQHDRRRCPPDLAEMQKREDFPSILRLLGLGPTCVRERRFPRRKRHRFGFGAHRSSAALRGIGINRKKLHPTLVYLSSDRPNPPFRSPCNSCTECSRITLLGRRK